MPLYPGVAQPHGGYIASRIYATGRGIAATSIAVPAIDVIYFYPFVLPRPISFVSGRARTQTAGTGSSMKGGIWANSLVSMRPLGAPIYVDNTGVATTSSTTDVTLAFGAGTLAPGVVYWFGSKHTGTLPTMWTTSNVNLEGAWLSGVTTNASFTGLSIADTYSNSMPTLAEGAGFSNASSGIPHLWLNT